MDLPFWRPSRPVHAWPLPGRRFHVHGLHRTWPPAHHTIRLGVLSFGRGCVSVCSTHAATRPRPGPFPVPVHGLESSHLILTKKEEKGGYRFLPRGWTRGKPWFRNSTTCARANWLDDSVPIVPYDMISFSFDNSVIPATLRPRSAPVTQLATFTSWWSGLILPANKPSILRAWLDLY